MKERPTKRRFTNYYFRQHQYATSGSFMRLMALVMIAAGCGPLASPTPTPTDVIYADCWVYFNLSAWEDQDGDGVRADGEPPLEGVEITLGGYYAHAFAGPTGSTDDNGMLSIDTWSPGGCFGDYEITATAPDGYEPTTDTFVTVLEDDIVSEHEFGFRLAVGE